MKGSKYLKNYGNMKKTSLRMSGKCKQTEKHLSLLIKTMKFLGNVTTKLPHFYRSIMI